MNIKLNHAIAKRATHISRVTDDLRSGQIMSSQIGSGSDRNRRFDGNMVRGWK
jgi:hypothetical protein